MTGWRMCHFERSEKSNFNFATKSLRQKRKEEEKMMRRWIICAFAVVFIFAGMGTSQAYEVKAVSDGAIIKGKVLFKGDPPPPRIFNVEKNVDICGETRQLKEVAVKDGKLADTFVYLEDVKSGKPFPGGGNEFTGTDIVARGCAFHPFEMSSFTGVIGRNKSMTFKNKDPIGHNPHTYEIAGRVRLTVLNRVLEGNGEFKSVVKLRKKKSRILKLECDQHNFMHNFFYTIENPYYSITREKGAFLLDQIPPGNYKLVVWHPTLGTKKQTVTIKAKESKTMTFEFSD